MPAARQLPGEPASEGAAPSDYRRPRLQFAGDGASPGSAPGRPCSAPSLPASATAHVTVGGRTPPGAPERRCPWAPAQRFGLMLSATTYRRSVGPGGAAQPRSQSDSGLRVLIQRGHQGPADQDPTPEVWLVLLPVPRYHRAQRQKALPVSSPIVRGAETYIALIYRPETTHQPDCNPPVSRAVAVSPKTVSTGGEPFARLPRTAR
jgi:hypothetical protein